MIENLPDTAENPDAELLALVNQLHETQRRIKELTGGKTDKVVHIDGHSYLLHEAQEKLVKNEADQRRAAETQKAILNALPAHIALIDADGVILSVNDSWRRFASANFLQGADFFVGQNYLEVCERATGDCSSEAQESAIGIRRVLRGEIREFSLEYPCHSPNEERWFRLMVTPLREDSRMGAVVMHINVSERRLAEEALRGSEKLFFSSFADAPVGMALGLPDGRYLKVNRALCQMLGYSEEEMLAQTYQKLTYPEDMEADSTSMQALLAGEVSHYQMEKRYIHRNGHLVWAILSVSLVRDDEGKPIHLIAQIQDITDRKRDTEALALAEQRLSFALEAADVGDWTLDLLTNASQRSLRHDQCFGYREMLPEWGYDTFLKHVDLADRAHVATCFEKAMADLGSFDDEFRTTWPDGSVHWLWAKGNFYFDAEGKPLRVAGIIADITHRKEAERLIEESEQRLTFALNAGNIGDWDMDLRTNVARRSLRHDQCFGYQEPVTEWGYDTFLSHVQPMDRDRVDACFQKAMAGKGDYDVEFRVTWPDGSEHWLWSRGCFYFDEAGKPYRVAGIQANITERKRIEQALQESEERSRAIVESSLDAIITMDHQGMTTEFNPAAEKIFGYSRAEALGREMADLIIPLRFREGHRKGLARYLQSEESQILGRRLEFPGLRADGTELPVELTVTRMGSFHPPRFTGFLRDITERKRAESALEEALNRLNEAQRVGKIGDWEWDIATQKIAWSPQVFEIVGRDPVLGPPKNYEEQAGLYDEASVALLHQKIALAIETSERQSYELVVLRPGGQRIYVEAMAVPRKDTDGKVVGLYGTIQDISTRKRYEQKLFEASRLLTLRADVSALLAAEGETDVILQKCCESLVDQLGGAFARIWILDNAGSVLELRASAGLYTHLDGPHSRVKVGEFKIGRIAQSAQPHLTNDVTNDPNVSDQEWAKREKMVAFAGYPLLLDGKVLGVMALFSKTELSQAVLDDLTPIANGISQFIKRKQGEDALLESEMRFRSLLQGVSSVAVQSYRLDGTTQYWNTASEKFYGYTAEEAVGRNLLDLIIPSEMRDGVKQAIQQMAETGQVIPSDELTLMCKDGSPVTVFSSHAIVNIAGRDPELFCIDIDLTERKRAELEISRTNRALKMLSGCNEALIRAEDEEGLLKQICQIAIEIGGYRMAWVGYAQQDEAMSITPMAFAGVEEGYLSEIRVTWNEKEASGQGPAGQSICTGQAVAVPDFAGDTRFKPWLETARKRGYRGIICLPLRDAGRPFGLLALYSANFIETTDEELKLLQEMADDLAFGILNLRMRRERERTQQVVLKMAQGISASTGEEFFNKLTHSMVNSLGAHAGFIARLILPEESRVRTICAVLDGKTIPNFEYDLAGTPCENLKRVEVCVVPRNAQQLYPTAFNLSEVEIESYLGTRLLNAAGQPIGIMLVQFRKPLEREEFVSSTLKIFAARAAAELERQGIDARIREQAALLDKAQDAILVRDLDHRISYWNKGAELLYGWTAEEASGQIVRELLKADAGKFAEADRVVRETGEWIGEIQKTAKNGQVLTLNVRWTLVRDTDGIPRSILAIETDITEKKKIEQQFLRSQRMESIGTLAGGIAHDLNNSLAPIIMSLELLQMKFQDAESQKLLSIISSSAQRGADMVQQVLSFARGVEGRRIEVQVQRLLRDIEKITNETFLKHIQVGVIIPKNLWNVLGDPTQLHQVLLNLCVNARDAMPDGGTLTLSAQNVQLDAHYAGLNPDAKPGPYVFLQVEDSGTGMPAGIIEKIFDPFFTTKEIGKGTGLGLSTSLAIVKSHGGFLRVYSETGKGTKFKVYLPALTEPSADSADVTTELPRGNGELILVIDDEPSVRQITQQTLVAFGYRVILASDGSEAIAIYAARSPEIAVVLTDMMMPVMDGPSTIRVLRKLNSSVRIIGASGLSANGHVAKSAGLGVKHFLPKPYTAETLLKVLKEILSEKP